MFPGAPELFIDLSTGINPCPYPLPPLPDEIFARLPDPTAIRRLAEIAARYYGAASADHVVPAPGTQILLPILAKLVSAGRAAVVGPAYAEHMRAAVLAGHCAAEVTDLEQLRGADLAIVVNPNNPDGRIFSRPALLSIADKLSLRGGMLIVDEAFADVMPAELSLAGETTRDNVVVLRSFGKFFGLAGLRLGFALAAPRVAERINAMLGPWAVAGPAIFVGTVALADEAWRAATLSRLAEAGRRLDRLLVQAGLEILGGTSLYRLTQSAKAPELFNQFGRRGILLRRFVERPTWLRWGLPKDEVEWERLSAALSACSGLGERQATRTAGG
jgi:cobalamin biosynthesis protein CobC